jgi:nitrogen fixation/metabolism regulation signal transduction histidine kinase
MAGARASDFIAAVSHEIRTPLNGVSARASLLDAGLPSSPRSRVRTIRSSAQALLAILNDILDFSRMEAGKLELVNEPFDLREAVEEVLDLLVPTAAAKGVELVLRWAPDAPSTFVGDALRWKQVVLNLAGNAVKFTERDARGPARRRPASPASNCASRTPASGSRATDSPRCSGGSRRPTPRRRAGTAAWASACSSPGSSSSGWAARSR